MLILKCLLLRILNAFKTVSRAIIQKSFETGYEGVFAIERRNAFC